jgi:hypothetical protein
VTSLRDTDGYNGGIVVVCGDKHGHVINLLRSTDR